MKYLCLIYDEEAKMANMSEADANAFMGEYYAFTNDIKGSGHYIAGEALNWRSGAQVHKMSWRPPPAS